MKKLSVDNPYPDLFKTKPTVLEEILGKGVKRLKSVVPQGKIVVNSYDPAKILHPEWANHVQSLNERVSDSRKRARKMDFDFDITLNDVVEIWLKQKGQCALVSIEMDWRGGTLQDRNPLRASIDRIDVSKGYVKDNIRLVCHWANNARSTYSDKMFRSMCEQAVLGFSSCSVYDIQ
jgi:hypothetical protein